MENSADRPEELRELREAVFARFVVELSDRSAWIRPWGWRERVGYARAGAEFWVRELFRNGRLTSPELLWLQSELDVLELEWAAVGEIEDELLAAVRSLLLVA